MEEIKSNNEDPSDYVFDLLFKALFPNHSIGLPIAGSIESVEAIDAEKTKIHYQKLLQKKIVIAVSGNFSHQDITQLAKEKFAHLHAPQPERKAPSGDRLKLTVQQKNEISQVHCVFGIPGIAYPSPKRYQFSILNIEAFF